MNILVDIGNTRIKWRCLNVDGVSTDSGALLSDVVTLKSLKDVFPCGGVETIYLSNVGNDSVVRIFKEYARINDNKLHIVEAQKCMNGLTFAYEDIDRLGVDRCLAMIGAYDGVGVLVVDAGSAITADFIGAQGQHCGGYILPGYNMSKEVLLGKTARVGVLADLGVMVPGRNTEACVNNGFTMLYKSLLEGFVKMAEGLGITRYVVTGGDAMMLNGLGVESFEVYENLVLDGLAKYLVDDKWLSGVGL